MIRPSFRIALALLAALAFTQEVDAKAGAGRSQGSRGSFTYSPPPATRTAPSTAEPITRSQSAPPSNQGLLRPAPSPNRGFFGSSFGRGLLGGLLGAGLFGLLFGHGLFGGLGGLMSILGLALQVGLIVLAVRFALGFFRRQPVSAMAGAAPGVAMGSGSPQQAAPVAAPINIGPSDYDAFERRLGEIETAYGDEDLIRLRSLATPEMAGYFAEEIAENQRRGVINRIGDVRLLQCDLAQAWRERDAEYATLAMRFALIDATYDRANQRLVAGNDNAPQESTEVWTFQRPANGNAQQWRLSAIQQASGRR